MIGLRWFSYTAATQFRYPDLPISHITSSRMEIPSPCFSPMELIAEKQDALFTTKAHAGILKSGSLCFDSGHTLIDGYIKSGTLEFARKLFDEMSPRRSELWNLMISAHNSHGRYRDALTLYVRMSMVGVSPDEYTFPSVFKSCARLGLSSGNRIIHGQCVVSGFEISSSFVCSSLVRMYSKAGSLQDARLLFDRSPVKDVVMHTALITGYAKFGHDTEAFEIFATMCREGIIPNAHTLSIVLVSCGNSEDLIMGKFIHTFTLKSGFESSTPLKTSLLTMYSKCGLTRESLKIFETVDAPNQITWTSLVSGLVKNGDGETAMTRIRAMIRSSVRPNSLTLSSVLSACSASASFHEGIQVHGFAIKLGWERSIYFRTTAIDLYGKCGDVEKARSVFDGAADCDIVLLDSMMGCYARNGRGIEAVSLFDGLESRGMKPSRVSFLNALIGCCNAGLVEEGWRVFRSMKNHSNAHITCMVDLLGRSGRIEEAECLLLGAGDADCAPWRALLNACMVHREEGSGVSERIVRRILDISPGDDESLVVLSNFYGRRGDWCRSSTLKMMRNSRCGLGLKKGPGVSQVVMNLGTLL